ncbi:MAG TPA: hypothetical protein VEP28_08240, partial [Rubrobacter sp.]|nr:hypothetical protein [Rubrobacter sp.]
MVPGDVNGAVDGARVHDHDLVSHRADGAQAPRQELLLVLRDQADRKQHWRGIQGRDQEWKKEVKGSWEITATFLSLSS